MNSQASIQGKIKGFGRSLMGTGDVITPFSYFGAWLYNRFELQDSDFSDMYGNDVSEARAVLKGHGAEIPKHFAERYYRTVVGVYQGLVRQKTDFKRENYLDAKLEIYEADGDVFAKWRGPTQESSPVSLRALVEFSIVNRGELCAGKKILADFISNRMVEGTLRCHFERLSVAGAKGERSCIYQDRRD